MTSRYGYWPIDNAAACQYKWSWSTIFLSQGSSSSCHRCEHWFFEPEEFDIFHNHPGKIGDREKMLQGEWPGNGCEYCKKQEDAGGQSERTAYVNYADLVPPEMKVDPTATHVTPRLLEVYFTNLCNQACVYCTGMFSSVIQAEIDKWGPLGDHAFLEGFTPNPRYEEYKAKFWQWMHTNAHHLYVFQILGGEPMYQPEFEECLDFFETHPCPHLDWRIFSNLKHDEARLVKKIDRIESLIERGLIKSFEIVCSHDCWGAEAEFARYGEKIENWKNNFEMLLTKPFVKLHIHSTISSLTLPSMAEFYRRIGEWRKQRPDITYGWNTVVNPQHFNPDIFGPYVMQYVDDLIAAVPVETDRDRSEIKYLDGIRKQIAASEINPQRLNNLRMLLDEIDRRRGTDWKSIYPWMVEAFDFEIPADFRDLKLQQIIPIKAK